MPTTLPSWRWRLPHRDLPRWITGWVGQLVLRAWAAAALVSGALSGADSFLGKCRDAFLVVPNLRERYEQASYVMAHRDQIVSALDYLNTHAPDAEQLDTAVRRSSDTLDRLSTTYEELNRGWDSFSSIRPTNVLDKLPEASTHLRTAWSAKPDLDSLQQLSAAADQVSPFLKQVGALDLDFSRLYTEGLTVLDNFAGDEILGTLTAMGAAFAFFSALALAVGFWARRGLPGFLARALQRLGARCFPRWYAANLPYALGPNLSAMMRTRVTSEIVADPHRALDEASFRELERWFDAHRASNR